MSDREVQIAPDRLTLGCVIVANRLAVRAAEGDHNATARSDHFDFVPEPNRAVHDGQTHRPEPIAVYCPRREKRIRRHARAEEIAKRSRSVANGAATEMGAGLIPPINHPLIDLVGVRVTAKQLRDHFEHDEV
ncbi:MAG: hypothetical protein AAFR84_06575 [Pseudomonadota bacterium]